MIRDRVPYWFLKLMNSYLLEILFHYFASRFCLSSSSFTFFMYADDSVLPIIGFPSVETIFEAVFCSIARWGHGRSDQWTWTPWGSPCAYNEADETCFSRNPFSHKAVGRHHRPMPARQRPAQTFIFFGNQASMCDVSASTWSQLLVVGLNFAYSGGTLFSRAGVIRISTAHSRSL